MCWLSIISFFLSDIGNYAHELDYKLILYKNGKSLFARPCEVSSMNLAFNLKNSKALLTSSDNIYLCVTVRAGHYLKKAGV